MQKLKKITNKEIINIIVDKDALRQIKKSGEFPLEIRETKSEEIKSKDNLINLEIAFRKCDRFGVFE